MGEQVERTIRLRWPTGSVQLFGSAATGMCAAGSDADLCVLLPECTAEHTDTAAQITAIGQLLQERPNQFSQIEVISTARVPIVRCMCTLLDSKQVVQCDLVVNNTMALCNTAILQEMVQHSPMLLPLTKIVRVWTARRRLRGPVTAGSVSMYGWTILCIHSLQQQGLLPWVDVIGAAVPLGVAEVARDRGEGLRNAVAALINPPRPVKRAKHSHGPTQLSVAQCFNNLLKLLLLDNRYRRQIPVSLRGSQLFMPPATTSTPPVGESPATSTPPVGESPAGEPSIEPASIVALPNSDPSSIADGSELPICKLAQPGAHAWPRLRIEDPVELERDLGRYLSRKSQATLLRECSRAYLMVLNKTTSELMADCDDHDGDTETIE